MDRDSCDDGGLESESLATDDDLRKPAPGPVPAPGPEPEPLLPPGMHRAGITSYAIAPSSRALCFLCMSLIPLGTLKFQYQVKASKSYKDNRSLHASCAKDLPLATRVQDHRKVDGFSLEHGLSAETVFILENVAADLRPYAAGVPSGH